MDKINSVCTLLKEKKYFEAKETINNSLKGDVKLFNYYMGLYYCADLNFIKANYYFNIAESHGLNNSIFYYNYALTYLELKNWNKAKELFRKSIQVNKMHKQSYLNLAHILSTEGNFKEAYRVIKSCLSCLDDAEVLNYERILLNKITS